MTENEKKDLMAFFGNKIQVLGLDIKQSEKGMECELKPNPDFKEAIINHYVEGVKNDDTDL